MVDALFQSLPWSIGVFAAATLAILGLGTALSSTADRLADRTGWGEAVVGSIFLAGATSLPDFAATLTAAADGHAELAMSTVLGSMAANLVFLVIGDIAYRRANLEHAAASSTNLTLASLSVALLTLPLIAMVGPDVGIAGIHPVTPVLLIAYGAGVRLVRHAHLRPMWRPRRTLETVEDRPAPDAGARHSLVGLWLRFAGLAALVAAAGWALIRGAETIAEQTALSEGIVGALLAALATSSPEIVTTIAAVRRGALTLAVAGIVGTNCFNTTAIAAADVLYRGGSIYHAVGPQQLQWGLLAILMTAVLLLGFVRRQMRGPGNIGFESTLILLLYGAAVALMLVTG